ncbi:calponin-3 isoform X1 [Nycticebus coucang]|uniref:calponin-3 isoform X1 n=1 Tax=Nycticebus coucang TaxID=9470 RepID=UPI00234E137F|nr:calponin-3 isoform X1 [Nycticebus coucang]
MPAGLEEEVGAVRGGAAVRAAAEAASGIPERTERLCGTRRTESPRRCPRPAAVTDPALPRRASAEHLRGGHSSEPGAGKPSAIDPRPRVQPLPAARTTMTHFNKGPSYGLSAEVKNKIASKYDHQAEEDLRNWIEEVTGMSIGTNFQLGLKDGIILCELINKLQPGSVKKVNESSLNWPQLENIGNFIKAIQAYGMKPHDIFEANDLFENGNMTQVQTTLVALAGLAKTKGFHTTIDIGVKYAEKQTRRFDEGKLKAGQSVIGLQMGTNKCASQAGMTAYGTRRHLYDPKMQTDKPFDQTTISLQMGTNKGASQAGMLAPGTRRDIYDQKLTLQPVDNSTISLQMGTNKVASQKGMSVYGLGRQVYDPKYCAAPTEPVIHNGSQGTGTNGSEISDSDYQAEYPDEYHGEYQDDYPRDYQYGDQGIDY